MKLCVVLSSLSLCAVLAAGIVQAEERDFVRHHEHVLGSSMELRMRTTSAAVADSVEQTTLNEIERLAKILSRHDAASELMRWQVTGGTEATQLSPALTAVLLRAEHWRLQTSGAFDVRAAAVMALWDNAKKNQTPVKDEDRRKVVEQLRSAPYELTDAEARSTALTGVSATATHIRRHDSLPITLDALAKGYILDAVCEKVVAKFPEVRDFSVMIGGDLRKLGNQPLPIAIVDPTNPAEGAASLGTITADRPLSLATSGNYRRFYEVSGRRVSHIVDPRTGLTAGDILSATVIAPHAMDADALATSLSVLAPNEGLALVESLEETSCLLILADGQRIASSRWPKMADARPIAFVAKEDAEESKTGLLVNFTLNRAKGGGPYRRPYVAVWLEDSEGFPVKTALLWLLKEQPGPRWHRDLTRWYRNDRTRKLIEDIDLIGTISGATRGPGEYEARFDGTDNAGKALPHDKYFLCIESAREHGTYQIIRTEVELKGEPIAKQDLKENVEMSKVSFEYVPTASGLAAEQK